MAQTKTMDTLVIQKFVENNMIEKYMLAIGGLGIFFLALVVLETLINFAVWLYQRKRK